MAELDDKDQRRWIIGVISDGEKSDYWKLLKGAILEWIEDEHKRLDYYKRIGIYGDLDIEKYNRAVDRIKYLNRFLKINETIVDYHKSFMDKVKEKVENFIDMGESFVGKVMRGG